MIIKILQLNIFQGKFLPQIIDFVRKNDIDIFHFQEVTTGRMSGGGKYKYPKGMEDREITVNDSAIGINCFEQVKTQLDIDGEYLPTYGYINDPSSTEGNATFFKKEFKLLSKKIVWFKDFVEITPDFTDIPALSRAALITEFEIGSRRLTTINTHLTWGPTGEDEPYKIEQAQKLLNVVRTILKPLILTGDFNVTPKTQTASMFDIIGRNLTKENGITNTLNPNLHPAKNLFPPGLAVDYVFTSNDLQVKSFRVIEDVDLSDHLGLLTELEL